MRPRRPKRPSRPRRRRASRQRQPLHREHDETGWRACAPGSPRSARAHSPSVLGLTRMICS
jgi:hypothetical protein